MLQTIRRSITKADLILFLVLVVLGLAVSIWLGLSSDSGSKVEIEVAGKPYATYSLAEDRTVKIRQGSKVNIIKISKGIVSMAEASCHNQVCVDHAPISRTGESIVCLPNKVIVAIEGKGGDRKYDTISN